MVNEELLKKIKDALDFTFDDEEIDWTIPSQERFLLKNYCLYELNHVSEQFNDNYRNDILQVRRKYEVRQWRDFQDSMTE